MKIAIFGTLKSTTSYRDWEHCFRRRFWKEAISEVLITEGNSVLNSYVKRYCENLSLPIRAFNLEPPNGEPQSKLQRNKAIIQQADIVVACVDDLPNRTHIDAGGVALAATDNKPAVVVNVISQEDIHISNNEKTPMEVNRDELITLEEEIAIIKQIQRHPENSEAEKEKLLYVNRRFVRAIAQNYASFIHPVNELMEEGNKGILWAATKFDETSGFKFISFATWYIKESIKQFIEENK